MGHSAPGGSWRSGCETHEGGEGWAHPLFLKDMHHTTLKLGTHPDRGEAEADWPLEWADEKAAEDVNLLVGKVKLRGGGRQVGAPAQADPTGRSEDLHPGGARDAQPGGEQGGGDNVRKGAEEDEGHDNDDDLDDWLPRSPGSAQEALEKEAAEASHSAAPGAASARSGMSRNTPVHGLDVQSGSTRIDRKRRKKGGKGEEEDDDAMRRLAAQEPRPREQGTTGRGGGGTGTSNASVAAELASCRHSLGLQLPAWPKAPIARQIPVRAAPCWRWTRRGGQHCGQLRPGLPEHGT